MEKISKRPADSLFERAVRLCAGLSEHEKIALVKQLSPRPLLTPSEVDRLVQVKMDAFWREVEGRMAAAETKRLIDRRTGRE